MISRLEDKFVAGSIALPEPETAGCYQAFLFVTFFSASRRPLIIDSTISADPRLAELKSWIDGIESIADAEVTPASGDASFRRYFRLQQGPQSFIAMDAPPAREDCLPFLRVAGYLESMQLNAPRIVGANLELGFLLLTDLGSTQYLQVLTSDPSAAAALYADALDALQSLQHRGAAYQSALPPYDEALLRFELSLFRDWLCGTHLGLELSTVDEAAWRALTDILVGNALDQPQVFVHRDYHSRNLMVTQEGNPGILDFQDAVEGPLTYDLASLLKDVYVRWPPDMVRNLARDFYLGIDDQIRVPTDWEQFLRWFELMGVQRHLKVAGIFARLNHRDGKPDYMQDVPLALGYILELSPRYPELDDIARFINERCLPGVRARL